ncbi:MAG: hypothetical protein IPO88_03380 [Nannocystis sp.]|uniref:tetratricopeptide repeat protein n=1 Tax=Nannocystis sp. TaxID=1962667 RepID=UPI002423069B|nr:tetratricopeptide repeat protein [Nannocystis sp.]MBK9752544.1 hypothetical protein [Nannocystis sp.]
MRPAQRSLLRAAWHAEAGRWGSARAEALAAVTAAPADGVVQLAAAHLLHVTRDHQRGLVALGEARRLLPGEAPRILRRVIACAESLGWEREVAEACAEGRRLAPRDPAWDALLLAMHRRGGDDEAALVAAEAALQLAPRWSALQLERAAILARLGRGREAGAAVARALELAPLDARAHRCEAASVLVEAGDFRGAAAQWHAALAQDGAAVGVIGDAAAGHAALAQDGAAVGVIGDAVAGLAELCLRVGDRAGAAAWAARAGAGGRPLALRVAGASDMSSGTWSAALARFDEALALADEATTWLWRAEALLRLGRDAEAADALTRAGTGGRGDNFVAALLRLLLAARAAPDAELRPLHVEAFAAALHEQGPELGRALEVGTLAAGAVAVEAALRRLGGSREAPLSWCDVPVPGDSPLLHEHVPWDSQPKVHEHVPWDSQPRVHEHVPWDMLTRLRRFASRGGPRRASRSALGTIRGAEAGRVLARFAGVIAAHPASSLPICHRGELRLWLGDVDAAVADLDAALAISPHTRWAYIGRTMAALLQGDPAAALAEDARGVAMMGGEGPAVYVHRGEALRRLGRPEAALLELRRAVGLHPGRLGAWLNLGLSHAALGGHGGHAGLAAVFDRLRERSPGLVSDAAAACGLAAWRDPDDPVPAAAQQAVLARALVMLRGNRSSSLVTYFTEQGQLRVAQDGAPAGRGPHARDAQDLAQARALARGARP